jgi:hypothetical protein
MGHRVLTIVKDVGVESNGRWATIPLTATGSSVVGREQPLLPARVLTKSEWCGCAKCQAGRKTLQRKIGPCTALWPLARSQDLPAVPKAVSLGFGLFELAHNRPLAHFQNLEQRQVKTLTTDQRILLIYQTAKALKMSSSTAPTSKTFGKSTRSIPHPTEKAQKWYPAEDEAKPRQVCGCIHF